MVKVAVITDDGETISQHFGRAPYYAVFTVEEGQIVAKELRDKIGMHLAHYKHILRIQSPVRGAVEPGATTRATDAPRQGFVLL